MYAPRPPRLLHHRPLPAPRMPPSHVNTAPPHSPRHHGAHTSQTPSLPFAHPLRDHVAAGAPSPACVPAFHYSVCRPARPHVIPVPLPLRPLHARIARPCAGDCAHTLPRASAVRTAAGPYAPRPHRCRALLPCAVTPVPLRRCVLSACPSRPTSTPPSRPPPVRCYAYLVPPPPVPTSAPPPPSRHARPSPPPSYGRVPLSRPYSRPYSRPPPRRHASLLHDCAAAHPSLSRPHLATAPSARTRTRPRVDTPMRCDHTVSASRSGSLPAPAAQSRLRAPVST
jgi:hypothetical protein